MTRPLRLAATALGLAALAASGSSQQPTAPSEGVAGLGKPIAGDIWATTGPRVGTFVDATELSGRVELSRFLVQPAASRGLRGLCEARREAEDFTFETARVHLAQVQTQGSSLDELVLAHHDLGQVYSYRGQMSDSVQQLREALRIAAENRTRNPALADAERYLETILGVAELRRGEVENCLQHANADRCLFPLRKPGQHDLRSGSTEAIRHFERLLAAQPDDLEVRWLLNLAHMTLGTWPEGVPKAFVIPQSALRSADDPGLFKDVAKERGLDAPGSAGGALVDDLDDDGWLDIHLGTGAPSYSTLMPNRTFRNRGGKSFVDVTTATGTGHLQKGHGVVFADMDDDGELDLLENIGGFVPGDSLNKVLFKNPGQGNDWVRLKLVGSRSNRAAMGARLKLVVESADGSVRELHRVVSSGGSFGSSPLTLHIGLGRAKRIRSLEVRWPIAGVATQTFRDLPIRQLVTLREGERGFQARPVVQPPQLAARR